MFEDVFKHARRPLQNVIVPIAQNTKSFLRQNQLAALVAQRLNVLAAIDLDNNFPTKTDEVQNEAFDWYLTPKFESYEPSMPQQPPHRGFGFRGPMAHLPGMAAAALGRWTVVETCWHCPLTGSGLSALATLSRKGRG